MLNNFKKEFKKDINKKKNRIVNFATLLKGDGFKTYMDSLNLKMSERNEDGVIVVYDDVLLSLLDRVGSCATMLEVEGLRTPVIFVDKKYKDTSISDVLYYQSLAHVNYMLRERKYSQFYYKNILKADEFAIEKVGAQKVLECLEALRENDLVTYLDKREMDMRIAEVKVNNYLEW